MEEDHIHSTPSSHTPLHMAAAPFSLFLSIALTFSPFALSFWVPFIGKDGSSSINGCTWVAPLVNGWCNCQVLVLQIVNGCCCTLNGNTPNNHPLWYLYGQLSSCFFSTILHFAALPSLPFRERLWPSLQVLAKPFNHQSYPSTPLLTPKAHFNQMVCHISSEEC